MGEKADKDKKPVNLVEVFSAALAQTYAQEEPAKENKSSESKPAAATTPEAATTPAAVAAPEAKDSALEE